MKLVSLTTVFCPNRQKEDRFVGRATYYCELSNKLVYKEITNKSIIDCGPFEESKEEVIPFLEHDIK